MRDASKTRAVWGWALYDWANSAFATTVMAGFFPLYFKTWCAVDLSPTESSAHLGYANAIAGLIVALSAPILGAVADAGGYKKRFLAFFTLCGAIGTASLAFLGKADWAPAVTAYATTGLAFAAALCFYDALLPTVADPENVDRVSALGFALGYIGGGILFALNIWMYQGWAFFGFTSPVAAVKASFITVSVWWTLFTLPLLWLVRERQAGHVSVAWRAAIRSGFSQLWETLRHVRSRRTVVVFLIAFYLYNDGIGTTMKMSIDYGLAIGLKAQHLVLALLMVQFIGFPATLLFGRLAGRWHPKRAIYLCIGVYVVGIIWATRMHSTAEFFGLAALIGCVQGGVQSLSRSFYARLIPRDRAAEYYGFYSFMGKFSGIAGPAVMAWVALRTGSSRLSILTIALFFVAGAAVLSRVRDHRPQGASS